MPPPWNVSHDELYDLISEVANFYKQFFLTSHDVLCECKFFCLKKSLCFVLKNGVGQENLH